MTGIFENVENVDENIDKLLEPRFTNTIIEDYLKVTFSLITYCNLDLNELVQCGRLSPHIEAMGFWFDYNSRDYLFVLARENGKNFAKLVQFNKNQPTSISEADLDKFIEVVINKYNPKKNVEVDDLYHFVINKYDVLVSFHDINVNGNLDPYGFRDDIEQYFVKWCGKMIKNKIQVNLKNVRMRQIVEKRLNPKKIKTSVPNLISSFGVKSYEH
jgi:hypothetical protein